MRDWPLARVMWGADRGFSSTQNRRELRRGGGHYIIGEKLRSGSAEATAALSRPGRYQHVRDNLQVKDVKIAADERFVICYNPEQADRDAALREVMTDKLTTLLADTDRLTVTKRAELRGRISTRPGLNRLLRVPPKGLLRLDKAKIASEANLDGTTCCAARTRTHVRRRHHAGLQAVAAGRTRLARHEDHPGTAAGLSPARRPHPRARDPLLARAAAGEDRRDHHR